MAVRYNDTDYMYSSTRVRALEVKLASSDALFRMCEAASSADICASLGDYGFEPIRASDDPASPVLREDTLTSLLTSSYADMEKMTDGKGTVDFLRYPYDCNNLKAAIKCASRGISADRLLSDAGTVNASSAKKAYADKDFSLYPSAMKKAVGEAEEAFAKTGNPQAVDFILDRACYEDMLASVKQTGVAFGEHLVRTKIDLTNIMTCVRVLRLHIGAASASLLDSALIEGGYLDTDIFRRALSGDEARFGDELRYTDGYYKLAAFIGVGESLATIEKRADDLWMLEVKQAKSVPFGAPVLIAYMAALEYQVKNIRIILAGKDAGLSADVIRERLRESYV